MTERVVSKLPPEAVPAIRLVMGKLTPLAVTTLVKNILSDDTSPSEKRKAAELILAYGWGRPVNTTVIDEKAPTHLILDANLQKQISTTFSRIDKYINQNRPTPTDVAKILDPILELSDMLDPNLGQPMPEVPPIASTDSQDADLEPISAPLLNPSKP